MSTSSSRVLLVDVTLLGLVACASAPSADVSTEAASLKPEGCNETICDLDWERCFATPTGEYSSMAHCDRARAACRRTPAELGCVDGLPPSSLPNAEWSSVPWKPPIAPHQAKCTDAEIDTILAECTPGLECYQVSTACVGCIGTRDGAEQYGAFVRGRANEGGCVASVDGDTRPESCGAKLFAETDCLVDACPTADVECLDLVKRSACKPQYEEATKCRDYVHTQPRYDDCFPTNASRDARRPLMKHFCGKNETSPGPEVGP